MYKAFCFFCFDSYFNFLNIFTKLWMKNRKAFSLTGIAAFHNLLLSIWSFIMLVGTIYELVQLYLSGGVMKIYCDSSSAASGAIYYWIYIYYFSKFVEFFDTVIIILRKKPLIFLHVIYCSVCSCCLFLKLGLPSLCSCLDDLVVA